MKFSNLLTQSKRKLAVVFTALVACGSLSGCIQSSAAERFVYHSDVEVPEATLKAVNSNFYTSFNAGDWYYKGAEAMNGTINAYIQIPHKLNMSVSDQKNYLRQAICPTSEKTSLWNNLKGIPLSVHIYTYNKKFTVYAHCENPMV